MQAILKNGEQLTLRFACPDDAGKLIEYINAVGGESDNLSFGANEFNISVEAEANYIRSLAARDNAYMLLAECNGEIVSCACLEGGQRNRTRHAATLGLTVRREKHGCGVGTLVIRRLIELARENEILKKINLQVRCDNVVAIKLYENCGFEREGIDRRTLCINDEFVDFYYMGLLL
ncbi:MAG: GNAT family N-acetyltransferase [Negativicutes bacterium]|jgi:RimJ/RimL family protein N-acetyltransferase